MFKHSIGHILGMVHLTDMKQKGSASTGCGANYEISTFDMTHDLDLEFLRSNFEKIALSQEMRASWHGNKVSSQFHLSHWPWILFSWLKNTSDITFVHAKKFYPLYQAMVGTLTVKLEKLSHFCQLISAVAFYFEDKYKADERSPVCSCGDCIWCSQFVMVVEQFMASGVMMACAIWFRKAPCHLATLLNYIWVLPCNMNSWFCTWLHTPTHTYWYTTGLLIGAVLMLLWGCEPELVQLHLSGKDA